MLSGVTMSGVIRLFIILSSLLKSDESDSGGLRSKKGSANGSSIIFSDEDEEDEGSIGISIDGMIIFGMDDSLEVKKSSSSHSTWPGNASSPELSTSS